MTTEKINVTFPKDSFGYLITWDGQSHCFAHSMYSAKYFIKQSIREEMAERSKADESGWTVHTFEIDETEDNIVGIIYCQKLGMLMNGSPYPILTLKVEKHPYVVVNVTYEPIVQEAETSSSQEAETSSSGSIVVNEGATNEIILITCGEVKDYE